MELVKYFTMETSLGCKSCHCSEEKTPLLDSVEMSPATSPIKLDEIKIQMNKLTNDKSNKKNDSGNSAFQ